MSVDRKSGVSHPRHGDLFICLVAVKRGSRSMMPRAGVSARKMRRRGVSLALAHVHDGTTLREILKSRIKGRSLPSSSISTREQVTNTWLHTGMTRRHRGRRHDCGIPCVCHLAIERHERRAGKRVKKVEVALLACQADREGCLTRSTWLNFSVTSWEIHRDRGSIDQFLVSVRLYPDGHLLTLL